MSSQPQLEIAPAAPAAETPADQCPRCQKPLIDPAGLGWCKACGYCRSLEAEQNNLLLQASVQPTRGAALAGAAGQVPMWFWALIGGIGVVAALSLAAGLLLPDGDSLPRALWSTLQIAVGLLLIFAGQFCALVQIAHEDEKLSFKDALVPTRLWPLVGKRASRLYGCICTSTWGLALVVCAVLFIGGLKHWFQYLPNSKNLPNTQNSRPK